jgi:hypothetical protein
MSNSVYVVYLVVWHDAIDMQPSKPVCKMRNPINPNLYVPISAFCASDIACLDAVVN